MSMNVRKSAVSIFQKVSSKKTPAEIVDKLGIEIPKKIELAKRSKAEQQETVIRKALIESDFAEKINTILGKKN